MQLISKIKETFEVTFNREEKIRQFIKKGRKESIQFSFVVDYIFIAEYSQWEDKKSVWDWTEPCTDKRRQGSWQANLSELNGNENCTIWCPRRNMVNLLCSKSCRRKKTYMQSASTVVDISLSTRYQREMTTWSAKTTACKRPAAQTEKEWFLERSLVCKRILQNLKWAFTS